MHLHTFLHKKKRRLHNFEDFEHGYHHFGQHGHNIEQPGGKEQGKGFKMIPNTSMSPWSDIEL